MNGEILSIVTSALILAALPAQSALLTKWDFNSRPNDNISTTGTLMPATGVGVASALGGISTTFAAGSPNDTATDDTAWNTSSYPSQSKSNKTAGIQLAVPTLGHTNISLRIEQRATGTASRFSRVQYSTNGLDFVDFAVLEQTEANAFLEHNVSFAGVAGVNDNPAFTIRIVTEFQSSATGTGANEYVTPSTSSYSASGAFRFDLATISGDPIRPGNALPTLAAIADTNTIESVSTGPIAVTFSDSETPRDQIILVVSSFNLALVPLENITVGSSANGKTIQIQPAPGKVGTALLAVTVLDRDGGTASDEFTLQVAPANAAPTLSVLSNITSVANSSAAPLLFTIDDLETPADLLNVSVATSNPQLVQAMTLGGGGAQRSLTLTPTPDKAGTAAVTVRVDDSFRTNQQTFVWMVLPQAAMLIYETFGYTSGPIISNAPGLWMSHAGTAGQLKVDDGTALVSTSQSEDVHIDLPGGPYQPAQSNVLYVAFTLRNTQLPVATGQYFLHFNTSGFRGRLFTTTEGAAAESYRLGVANAGTAPAVANTDMSLHQEYNVVLGYDTATGLTRLWIDPNSASDPATEATDSTTPAAITSLALRQQTGIGQLALQNLRVGTAFEQVMAPPSMKLEIQLAGGNVQLSWPSAAAAWKLQSNTSLNPNSWTDIVEPAQPAGDHMVMNLPAPSGTKFFRLRQP